MGNRFDFGGSRDPETGNKHRYVGQVKNVKSLSLSALTKLAEEMETAGCQKDMLGVVVVKLSNRRPTPHLVVMTETEWLKVRSAYELATSRVSITPPVEQVPHLDSFSLSPR